MNLPHVPQDTANSFEKRFGINPKNSRERIALIEKGNVDDFYVADSCMAPGQKGLFAKRRFKKGEYLGLYRGEPCKISDLKQAFRSKAKYTNFLKHNAITTKLSRKETCKQMEKLGYAIAENTVLVMPRYPINPEFYLRYNAMMYVNEPPDEPRVWNLNLKPEEKWQKCKINVLSFTNFKWQTIDYVAACDIQKNEELAVYYGNQYRREDYGVNVEGCNVAGNKVFFGNKN